MRTARQSLVYTFAVGLGGGFPTVKTMMGFSVSLFGGFLDDSTCLKAFKHRDRVSLETSADFLERRFIHLKALEPQHQMSKKSPKLTKLFLASKCCKEVSRH